jgi:hypothetical protein
MGAGFFLRRRQKEKSDQRQPERRHPNGDAQRLGAGKEHQRGKKHLAKDKDFEKPPAIARPGECRSSHCRGCGFGKQRISYRNRGLHDYS